MAGLDRFRTGLQKGELLVQYCQTCGAAQTCERHACAVCASRALSWKPASGEGEVFASTVVWRAPMPDLDERTPYHLVLVDLVEGSRLMGQGAPGLSIGDRVTAVVTEWAGRPIVRFEPSKSKGPLQ